MLTLKGNRLLDTYSQKEINRHWSHWLAQVRLEAEKQAEAEAQWAMEAILTRNVAIAPSVHARAIDKGSYTLYVPIVTQQVGRQESELSGKWNYKQATAQLPEKQTNELIRSAMAGENLLHYGRQGAHAVARRMTRNGHAPSETSVDEAAQDAAIGLVTLQQTMATARKPLPEAWPIARVYAHRAQQIASRSLEQSRYGQSRELDRYEQLSILQSAPVSEMLAELDAQSAAELEKLNQERDALKRSIIGNVFGSTKAGKLALRAFQGEKLTDVELHTLHVAANRKGYHIGKDITAGTYEDCSPKWFIRDYKSKVNYTLVRRYSFESKRQGWLRLRADKSARCYNRTSHTQYGLFLPKRHDESMALNNWLLSHDFERTNRASMPVHANAASEVCLHNGKLTRRTTRSIGRTLSKSQMPDTGYVSRNVDNSRMLGDYLQYCQYWTSRKPLNA